MDTAIKMVQALATPVTIRSVLLIYKPQFTKLFDAIGDAIRERKIKVTAPGVSAEISTEIAEAQRAQREIVQAETAAPEPPAQSQLISSVTEVIEAKRFTLRDENEKAPAEISMITRFEDKPPEPQIRLYGADGECRVLILGGDDLSCVRVNAKKGGVSLIASDNIAPFLAVSDASGKLEATFDNSSLRFSPGVEIYGAREFPPSIKISDQGGNVLFSAP